MGTLCGIHVCSSDKQVGIYTLKQNKIAISAQHKTRYKVVCQEVKSKKEFYLIEYKFHLACV